MFLANFRKEIREDGLGIARAGSDRRQRARGSGGTPSGADSGGERKSFQEACFKWNLGRPSRATKRVLKFILGSGFTVLSLGVSLSVVGFIRPEANPFRIIGPVLAVYGFLILFLSFDVCMRLKASVPSEMEATDGGAGCGAENQQAKVLAPDADYYCGAEQKNGHEKSLSRLRPPSPIKLSRSWGGDKMKGLIIGRNGELVMVKKQRSKSIVDEQAMAGVVNGGYEPGGGGTANSNKSSAASDGWYHQHPQSKHQQQDRISWQQPSGPHQQQGHHHNPHPRPQAHQPWENAEFPQPHTPLKMYRKGCG